MTVNNNGANANAIAVLQNIVLALNNIQQTLVTLFPSADNQISASAGPASGDFLTITVNGVNYKIELLDES